MKVFAVLAAVVAVAFATPSTWTLNDLSEALDNPTTSTDIKPLLEQALNVYMEQLFAGQQMESVTIQTAAGPVGDYTLAELDSLLTPALSSSIYTPYIENALDEIMDAYITGNDVSAVTVTVPALTLGHWELSELDQALSDPSTDAALLPYLESGLNQLMEHIFNSGEYHFIVIAVPTDLLSTPAPVAPAPVVAAPAPAAPAAPVAPVPVAPTPASAPTAAAPSSPLVSIILNINAPDAVGFSAPYPAIDRPTPVQSAAPLPFNPVDLIAMPVEELEPQAFDVGPLV